MITPDNYQKIRNTILGRIKRTSKLLRELRPEQATLRESLLKRREMDRNELANWDAHYGSEQKPAPIDGDFYEEPTRQLDRAA